MDDKKLETFDKVLVRQAKRVRSEAQRRASGERLLTHVPTGFIELDDTYGGVRRGVATALVAHTGVGKSTFARQISRAGAESGAGVLWVVGEDPEDATAERELADGTGISATELGRLDLDEGQLCRLDQAASVAGKWAKRLATVFDAPSVDDVLGLVDDTRMVGDVPLALVILDYAQIFGDADNLEHEVAKLARGMQLRAADRRIATLILSQASNDVIRRGREEYIRTGQKSVAGFLPGKGDIEWCKRMEKSTKAYWVLDRPGLWRREMGEDDPDDTAQLHVKKANFGPTGWVPLKWNGPRCRFENP